MPLGFKVISKKRDVNKIFNCKLNFFIWKFDTQYSFGIMPNYIFIFKNILPKGKVKYFEKQLFYDFLFWFHH